MHFECGFYKKNIREQIGSPGTLPGEVPCPVLKSFPPVEQTVTIPIVLRVPPQNIS